MSDPSSTTQRKIFVCPACQGKLAVRAELLGRKVKCRHCGQAVQTPIPTTAPNNNAPQGVQPLGSSGAPSPLPPVVASPSDSVLPQTTESIVTAEIVESSSVSSHLDVGLPRINTGGGGARRSTSRISSSRRKSSNGGALKVFGSLGGVLLVLVVVAARFGIRQYAEMQYEAECDKARIEAYQHYADVATPDVVKSMVDDFHEDCAAEATHGIRTPRFAKDEYFRAMDQLFRQAMEVERDQLQDMLDQLRRPQSSRRGT